jgi:rubredoxin
MEESLITLTTFEKSIDAHLVKSKLESEGIECYLFDENMATMNPLFNISIGAIKLKIKSSDEEKARLILKEIDQTPYTDENNQIIKCPNCHSEKIYSGFNSINSFSSVVTFLVSLLSAAIPLTVTKKYRCKVCGHEFKQKQTDQS